MPSIALSAGLLTLPATSETRLQYWPWLPLGALVLGLGFSCLFWLVIIPRRNAKESERRD